MIQRILTSTVGTVCTAAGFGGLVNVDVCNDEVFWVELVCHGVGLSIFQEGDHVFSGLDRPSS